MEDRPQHAVQGLPGQLRTYIQEMAIRFSHVEYTEYLVSQTFQGIQPLDLGTSPDLTPGQADPLHAISVALQHRAPADDAQKAVSESVEVQRETKKAIMGALRLQQNFKDGSFKKRQLQRPVRDPLPPDRRREVPVLSRRAMRSTPRIFSSAKDKSSRVPTKLAQLFKERGRFKVSGEMVVGPYEEGKVTLEGALLLERVFDSELAARAAEWTTSMKRAYLRVIMEAKAAGVPACWERMMELTKRETESAPGPISPTILPRNLLERQIRNLADVSMIGQTYRRIPCDDIGDEELSDLLPQKGEGGENHGVQMLSFEGLGSSPIEIPVLPHPNDDAFHIFAAGNEGQVLQNETPWRTKRMLAMGHDLRPEMHIMSLSNMEASEAVKQRDEWIRFGTSPAVSTPMQGLSPNKNRVVSPPSDLRHAAPLPTQLRPVRQVTVMRPPPDHLPSSSPAPQTAIRELRQWPRQPTAPTHDGPASEFARPPESSSTSPAERTTRSSTTAESTATTTLTGSTIASTSVEPPRITTKAAIPTMSDAEQLACRRKQYHLRESIHISTPGGEGTPRDTATPVSRPTARLLIWSGSRARSDGSRPPEAITIGSLSEKTSKTLGKPVLRSQSTPQTYNDLTTIFAHKSAAVEEMTNDLRLPPINIATVSASAGCSTHSLPAMNVKPIRNVWMPQALAKQLLDAHHCTFDPPPSPEIGCAQPELFEDAKPEERCSPVENTTVKQITYMPISKASSSKLPSQSLVDSRSPKRFKNKHVILQDGGSLDDIVRSRARRMTPSIADGKPRTVLDDTIDEHLQLLGKTDMVQKKDATKVPPKPIRIELLEYASERPKSFPPPAPPKKVDWRDHPLMHNPPWYDKMAKAPESSGRAAITLLTAVPLYRNRPLLAALEAGGFNLLEHDLPGQGIDLILSASTGIIFRPLKDISVDLSKTLQCIKLATQYFARILLVLEAAPYRAQTSDQDIDVNPLTPAVVKALSGLPQAISNGTQDKSSGSSGKFELIVAKNGGSEVVKVLRATLEAEASGLRRKISDVDTAEVFENRHWLCSEEYYQARWLIENFKLNSFSAAYVLLKCQSLSDFLYEWTEGDRTMQFGHVIGDKLIKRINAHLRPKPEANFQLMPSSDPLNLRPPN